MTTKDKIEKILRKEFSPKYLEVIDDSDKHAGHTGAKRGGGHFQLIIVSPMFNGKSAQQRHRMVHAALGDMLEDEIHSMTIQAYTPDEI